MYLLKSEDSVSDRVKRELWRKIGLGVELEDCLDTDYASEALKSAILACFVGFSHPNCIIALDT